MISTRLCIVVVDYTAIQVRVQFFILYSSMLSRIIFSKPRIAAFLILKKILLRIFFWWKDLLGLIVNELQVKKVTVNEFCEVV